MTDATNRAADEGLDDIQAEPVMLDPRTQAMLDLGAFRRQQEEWQAAEHRRRLAEGPKEIEAARRRAEASERLRLEALIPRRDALCLEEVEPDDAEVEQDRLRNQELASRLEAESRERRVQQISYDLRVDRDVALAWWRWEVGIGPKPTPVVVNEAALDDSDLDEVQTDEISARSRAEAEG